VKITIAERFHPFSHENGIRFLLPKTSYSIQVFPARLNFEDIDDPMNSFFISFDFVGPLIDFTAELDLELGVLRVFGMTKKGYMRYLLYASDDGIWLKIEKIPEEKLICRRSFSPEQLRLSKGESVLLPCLFKNNGQVRNTERLSLGIHKAQEWEFIRRRGDFKEIFPLWLSLSHWVPIKSEQRIEGNYLLLEECRQKIAQGEKQKVLESFHKLFLVAFDGVLVPRPYDTQYQGILPEIEQKDLSLSRLALLTKAACLIRSLFFQEKEKKMVILPCLPPDFSSGRMTGVKALKGVVLDFEWTKKNLRRMRVFSLYAERVFLSLPKTIRSCRVKKGRRILEKLPTDLEGGIALSLAANETIDLDCFQR
jgi:hypothetical protein